MSGHNNKPVDTWEMDGDRWRNGRELDREEGEMEI
jgi:hypothetical protein